MIGKFLTPAWNNKIENMTIQWQEEDQDKVCFIHLRDSENPEILQQLLQVLQAQNSASSNNASFYDENFNFLANPSKNTMERRISEGSKIDWTNSEHQPSSQLDSYSQMDGNLGKSKNFGESDDFSSGPNYLQHDVPKVTERSLNSPWEESKYHLQQPAKEGFKNTQEIFEKSPPGQNIKNCQSSPNSQNSKFKKSITVKIPETPNYVDEVEIGQSPAREVVGQITKEKFIENMDEIKKMILSNATNPDKRVKLMNGVMIALKKVEDKVERFEITQIFNQDDLILNFIKAYLKFGVRSKLGPKSETLKQIVHYNINVDILSKIKAGFENDINAEFLKIVQQDNSFTCTLDQIAYTLYGTSDSGFDSQESENLVNLFDLWVHLVQFIINDAQNKGSLSLLHNICFVIWNTKNDDLLGNIFDLLKLLVFPLQYSEQSNEWAKNIFIIWIRKFFNYYLTKRECTPQDQLLGQIVSK